MILKRILSATMICVCISLLSSFSYKNIYTTYAGNPAYYDTVPSKPAEPPPPPPPEQSRDISEDENKIFEKVETEASFHGETGSWRKFLEKNLNANVPVDKGAPAGVYTVYIQFVVDKDGKLTEFTPLTKHGYGMEAEVIRILKLSPPWNPATQNGRVVKAYRKQPVTFQVIEEGKKKRKD